MPAPRRCQYAREPGEEEESLAELAEHAEADEGTGGTARVL
jgi:hypothetical protein